MFVKKYIAEDMHEATERIRRELGPDAILLSQRQVRPKGLRGLFKKKKLEVMVAYESVAERAQKAASQMSADLQAAQEERTAAADKKRKTDKSAPRERVESLAPAAGEHLEEINTQLTELRGAVQELSSKLTTSADTLKSFSPEVSKFYSTLIAQSTDAALAVQLCERMQNVLERVQDKPDDVARTLLCETLGEAAPLRLKKYGRSIVMLIGPTGVGKTTTLVKLAGHYAISQNLKVGLINTDTYRVAAHEQIRTYAEIIEIPCATVYSPDELATALNGMQDRDLILIDTAGKSTKDKSYHAELEAYIKECDINEIFLAVSASMSPAACQEMIDNYSFLENYKLIITKMDEISTYGPVVNIAGYARKPIAYVTNGQNVPQDIAEADLDAVVNGILESAGVN